jgi:hypothetical protein
LYYLFGAPEVLITHFQGRTFSAACQNKDIPNEWQALLSQVIMFNELVLAQMPNLIKQTWLVRIAARATP